MQIGHLIEVEGGLALVLYDVVAAEDDVCKGVDVLVKLPRVDGSICLLYTSPSPRD